MVISAEGINLITPQYKRKISRHFAPRNDMKGIMQSSLFFVDKNFLRGNTVEFLFFEMLIEGKYRCDSQKPHCRKAHTVNKT